MIFMRCSICRGIFESTDTLRHKMDTGHNTWQLLGRIKLVEETGKNPLICGIIQMRGIIWLLKIFKKRKPMHINTI